MNKSHNIPLKADRAIRKIDMYDNWNWHSAWLAKCVMIHTYWVSTLSVSSAVDYRELIIGDLLSPHLISPLSPSLCLIGLTNWVGFVAQLGRKYVVEWISQMHWRNELFKIRQLCWISAFLKCAVITCDMLRCMHMHDVESSQQMRLITEIIFEWSGSNFYLGSLQENRH